MSFLNTQNLPPGHKVIIEIVDAFYPGSIVYLITNEHEAIFIRKDVWKAGDFLDEDEPGFSLEQFVVPLNAMPWLVDIIENKFWKTPAQGGAPADVLHYKNTVDDEKLKIRFTPNCLKKFEPGITIINYSRAERYAEFASIAIPYYTLRDKKLFQAMKSVRF
ncbi:hypothetical protein SG34_027150 [Thalassomonas viridans]|uniref:Uncharacterized protein n=1 Tax=Thalassomonas viridans TaxID=137584 RepID=A0AAE9Z2N6_9GAMM|nr:hypothetical protein [Thalassomonas viridans]WDE04940.1 hypothetical protein SG34_027150 [Thalassomonas viridans]